MKNGIEYDESNDKILDFVPEKYVDRCGCGCNTGFYNFEECQKYNGEYYVDDNHIVRKLKKDGDITTVDLKEELK